MKPLYSTPVMFRPMKEGPSSGIRKSPFVKSGIEDGHGRELVPPYRPGEKCYVREAWDCAPDDIADQLFFPVRYKAEDCEPFVAWRSPVTMPMWAARRFVTVLSCEPVKIEDVTEEDCLAVGLKKLSKDNGRTWKFGMADRDGLPGTDNTGWAWEDWKVDHREAFKVWWNKDKSWAWRVVSEEEK